MPKSLNFNRLRLRTKLLLLAALPLLGLVATSGLLVRGSFIERSQALEEQVEITRIGLAADLADSLVLERERTRSTSSQFRLDEARGGVDDAIQAYRVAVEDDAVLTADIILLTDEIRTIRSDLGDLETMMASQQMASAIVDGEDAQALALLDVVVTHALDLTNARPGAVATERTSINARSVQLLADYNSSLRAELRTYVEINEADNLVVADNARGDAFRLSGHVEQVEAQLLNIGDESVSTQVQALIDSPAYTVAAGIRERIATNLLDPSLAPARNFLLVFEPLFTEITALQTSQVERVQTDASDSANSAVVALVLSASATAFFVVVMALLVAALFRSIRAPLLSLTEQSRNIAKTQLPNVVAQIRELGGDAHIELPAPIVVESDDEVGELVDAFNQLHTTAIELAAEQAASRRTVSEMFVNLGRRNQKILMRLLASLEKLERNERDPEVLHELFRVDHLATRMRRNAESLLVLAGAKTSRSFGQAISVGDVVRSALAEVEDYERVTFDDQANALINGKAVADIGHLLAELIENALMFSPPNSSVEVQAARGPEGLTITVGDRGIGLTAGELSANNSRILDAADLTETPSRFLGLYVVGRLAHRHRLTVELLNGVPSGLIARIKLPATIFEAIEPAEDVIDNERLTRSEPAPAPTAAPSPLAPAAQPGPSSFAPASAFEPPVIDRQPAVPTGDNPSFEPPAHRHAPAQRPAPVAQVAQPPQRPAPVAQVAQPPAPVAQAPQRPAPVAQAPQRPAPVAQVAQPPAPVAQAPQFTQPLAESAVPFTLAKRTPVPLQSSERASPTQSHAPSTTPRLDPNKNLGGFQRSVPALASEPRTVPVERRRPIPGQGTPAPNRAAEADPGGAAVFAAPKRVPGASSLSRKVDPVAPADRTETPAPPQESAPQSAARFGANLAGFQRGVKRADTAPTAESVEDVVTQAIPPANTGEIS